MYKLSGAENAPERFFEGSLEEARIEAHLLLKNEEQFTAWVQGEGVNDCPVCSQKAFAILPPAQESRCRICGEESNGAPACWGCWDDASLQGLI